MALFRRKRRIVLAPGTLDRPASKRDVADIEGFVASRKGVEAYIEPRTNVTELTVLLIAADGEWTRRRTTEKAARALGDDLKIPVYDVQRTGYPQRMREWTRRQQQGGPA
ncbi:MAG: oxidoreductase [Antricoccus sp.]